jgi:hypothetical protein
MGISILGVFLPATLFFLMASNPGPNTVWAIMTSGVMLTLIFLLSLRGLKTAVFRSIAVWHIGPDGLTACFMGMTRRAPWREVYDMRRCGSTLLVDMGDRTLELRIPASLADDDMGDIDEFWACRRARGVPLVLQSTIGVGMWFVVTVLMLAFADLWLLMAFRPDAQAETLWTAAILSTIALASLYRAMSLVTEKIAIGPDHIERSTCFGHVMVPLREVRLLTHRRPALRSEPPEHRARIERKKLWLAWKEGVSLLVPSGLARPSQPRRTPGRICVASGKAHIRFNLRAYPFDVFMPDLAEACCQAAILDDRTGEVTPPNNPDSVQIVRESTAFCRRARRRYIALGLLQIVCLPGIWILWLVAILIEIAFINFIPLAKQFTELFSLKTAVANFQKAANVKRTCAQFGDI